MCREREGGGETETETETEAETETQTDREREREREREIQQNMDVRTGVPGLCAHPRHAGSPAPVRGARACVFARDGVRAVRTRERGAFRHARALSCRARDNTPRRMR